ncbi:MAG: T9SS type A sorting domain-containing protein, partial [Flavobacteriales bacterium]|nr:T9SS type A sorting domain-containing protein [Flavobacteriales bacterium]
ISPTDPTDDYDFAIWGPYPPGSSPGSICPPLSQPIRCSYSALTGNTGLNYTATDFTEGVGGNKWVDDLTVITGEVYLLYVSNWSQSGLAFNLNWDLQNGASLDCTVLPMELIDLTARAADKEVRLDWVTATEHNTDHFRIERSSDGDSFMPIGHQEAAGHSLSQRTYGFQDPEPFNGMNYYRLILVDQDGSVSRSEVVWASFNTGDVSAPFPNPAEDLTLVPIELTRQGTVEWRVQDALGRLVLQGTRLLEPGSSMLDLDLRTLPGGSYTLSVFREGEERLASYPLIRR